MTLSIFYRYSRGGNLKQRPPYFSKLACLLSFVRAVDAAEERTAVVFVVDGEVPAAEQGVMEAFGCIRRVDAGGNSPSYRAALRLATAAGSGPLVYLSEDDYLYLPESFAHLLSASRAIPEADYFTLYDHPDRYLPAPGRTEPTARIMLSGDRHWRSVPSTCMTYGARRAALRADRWIHWIGTAKGFPRDDKIWRATQGVAPFGLKLPKRLLVSPIPSLATHVESQHLAPGIEWAAVAREALEWARSRHLVHAPDAR